MNIIDNNNTTIMTSANIPELKKILTLIYEEGGIKALKDTKKYIDEFKSRCAKLEKSDDILLSEFIEHGDININVILKKLSENTRKNHKCVIKSLKSFFVEKRKAVAAEHKNNKLYDKIGKVAKNNHKSLIKSLKSYFVEKRKSVAAERKAVIAERKAVAQGDVRIDGIKQIRRKAVVVEKVKNNTNSPKQKKQKKLKITNSIIEDLTQNITV